MKRGVTLEVVGPIEAPISAIEPGLRRFLEGGKNILLNLSMPCQDFLWGTITPTKIHDTIDLVWRQAALIVRSALLPDGPDHIRLPVRDVDERILYVPGVFGLRPEQGPFPFIVRQFGHQPIEEFELEDGAFDHFSTRVTHRCLYPLADKPNRLDP
jgi:hypothetical protein